jgi:hypothetical protein
MKELKISLSDEKGSCGADLFVLEYDGKKHDALLWDELLGEVALITLPYGRHENKRYIGIGRYLSNGDKL